jgi:hypothetical protein
MHNCICMPLICPFPPYKVKKCATLSLFYFILISFCCPLPIADRPLSLLLAPQTGDDLCNIQLLIPPPPFTPTSAAAFECAGMQTTTERLNAERWLYKQQHLHPCYINAQLLLHFIDPASPLHPDLAPAFECAGMQTMTERLNAERQLYKQQLKACAPPLQQLVVAHLPAFLTPSPTAAAAADGSSGSSQWQVRFGLGPLWGLRRGARKWG